MGDDVIKRDTVTIALATYDVATAFAKARLHAKQIEVPNATVVEVELKCVKQVFAISGDVTEYSFGFCVEWY